MANYKKVSETSGNNFDYHNFLKIQKNADKVINLSGINPVGMTYSRFKTKFRDFVKGNVETFAKVDAKEIKKDFDCVLTNGEVIPTWITQKNRS